MKVELNDNEAVTVSLRSRGGGQIFVRAYGTRTPMRVLDDCLPRLDRRHQHETIDRLDELAASATRYRAKTSWRGK